MANANITKSSAATITPPDRKKINKVKKIPALLKPGRIVAFSLQVTAFFLRGLNGFASNACKVSLRDHCIFVYRRDGRTRTGTSILIPIRFSSHYSFNYQISLFVRWTLP